MTSIKVWQVNAFTNRPFAGNPAAVCWLDEEADPTWMQAVAAEMNLSETAFTRKLNEGLELRWFTPTVEVDLCGHATLATAHALWSNQLIPHDEPLRFLTKSGWLTCQQDGNYLELDFPALPAREVSSPPELLDALGLPSAQFIGQTKFDHLVVVDSPDIVKTVQPDFRKLKQIPTRGVMVTAAADDGQFDFVSRFFAPSVGVDEDPVCGSAHCCLGPYWSSVLGKQELMAHQISARGGVLRLKVGEDRVKLGGQAVTVWQGEVLADFQQVQST